MLDQLREYLGNPNASFMENLRLIIDLCKKSMTLESEYPRPLRKRHETSLHNGGGKVESTVKATSWST